ncbi:BTB and MATH domain-containing protein 15 [Caenorhabditis elegans]|nr:BTB and MATH domain-containing protein 15 [Caenorhabditis elegans]CCD63644.1 BTB and MATH domain-containing protein 15 [Caenorhabditis elegans]|eukprot:NP_498694.2 BTB and MATH domain-containing protein 15 [Caenorhabditis elegans]
MVAASKEFVFHHTFKDVSQLEDGDFFKSPEEIHYNAEWFILVIRTKDQLEAYLHCDNEKDDNVAWTVDAEFSLKIASSSGSYAMKFQKGCFDGFGLGWNDFVSWDSLTEDFLYDNSFTIEACVKITKMTGFSKDVLRSFDESEKRFSDVILVVGDEKFYVLKLFLASHSSYFNALFLGKFKEADQSEVTLQNIDPTDFQSLLEVLYGEPAIDDGTIDGVLLLAHMLDVTLAIRKCEEFLIEKSMKSMRELLKMANQYQLENLKTVCISKINTIDEIEAAMAYNPEEMDPIVLATLLKKSTALHRSAISDSV